jgi:type III restriction enzyme
MLKEGWDVRNVTTIVGLRAYSAKSNILPEQTLGRGLRKMYRSDVEEYVSVVGTDAFMDFVEPIRAEGVELERKAMGEGTGPKTPQHRTCVCGDPLCQIKFLLQFYRDSHKQAHYFVQI